MTKQSKPIAIRTEEDLEQLAKTLGLTIVRGPGPVWSIRMEGRDEQRYELVFTAASQNIFVAGVPIRPVTGLAMNANKLME